MKRIRRMLFNFTMWVLVLCCAGVLGMWTRSYFDWDRIVLNDAGGIGLKSIIHSGRGRLDVIVFAFTPRGVGGSPREFHSVPNSSHPTSEEKDRLQEWQIEKNWLGVPDALPWGFCIRVDVPNSPHLTQYNLSIRYGLFLTLMLVPALFYGLLNGRRVRLLDLRKESGEGSDGKSPAEVGQSVKSKPMAAKSK